VTGPGRDADSGPEGDPIGWLVAHEQIRQLASRYAVAIDARDLDTLVSLFVPDVRVGRDQVGRDALRDNFRAQLQDIGVSILLVGNHVIDVLDADHATGIVSCRGEIELGEKWVVQAIQYHDTYERRDGQWLFVRRRHLLFYGADLLERPIDLPPADWPANATGKGELPEMLETWQDFHRH
jgi:ketosteroid isomerase-like protein